MQSEHCSEALPKALPEAWPLPEGYAGGLMVELEDELRREAALAAFILQRARSLAWQAVRHSPAHSPCASSCLNWIRQARLWAARRDMERLSAELDEILSSLDRNLPRIWGTYPQ